jgi:hypothetical protein
MYPVNIKLTPYGHTTHCYTNIAKYLLFIIYQSCENRCLVFDERAPAAKTANDAAPSSGNRIHQLINCECLVNWHQQSTSPTTRATVIIMCGKKLRPKILTCSEHHRRHSDSQ